VRPGRRRRDVPEVSNRDPCRGASDRAAAARVPLLPGAVRALGARAGGVPVTGDLGVFGAVALAVRVGPCSTAQQVAGRIRPAGRVSVADVADALMCMRLIGLVRREMDGWYPGRRG